MPAIKKSLFLWFFLFIGLINLFVYYPSFSHPPRSDQIVYLAETASLQNLSALWQKTYSFNRTRELLPGDAQLFRPLYFATLNLEKTLYGYHFRLWQITGFGLHLLVLFLLFRLLWKIQPHWLAGLCTLHFSLLFTTNEMVIWHHVHGYLIFIAFILYALDLYRGYEESRWADHSFLYRMTLVLTVANFFFEFGLLVCAVLSFFIWQRSRKVHSGAKPILLWLPVAIYLIANLIDYGIHHPHPTTGYDLKLLTLLFPNFLISLQTILILPFLSAFILICEKERTHAIVMSHWQEHYSAGQGILFSLDGMVLLGPFLLLSLGAYFLLKSKRLGGWQNTGEKKEIGFCVLTLLLAGLYILTVIAIRSSISDPNYLWYNLYHFYIPWVFLTMTGYAFLSWGKDLFSQGKKALLIILVGFLGLNTLLNAQKSWAYNQQLKTSYAWWIQLNDELNNLVKKHRAEKDFSFQWVYRYRAGYHLQLKTKNPHRTIDGFDLDFLYKPYLDTQNPKYYLVYLEKEGLLVFQDRKTAEKFIPRKN